MAVDRRGVVEALEQELGKIQHEEVKVRIIRSGVGGITGSDVMLASASSAIIVGFNVRPNAEAKVSAEREGVDGAVKGILARPELAMTPDPPGEAEIRGLIDSAW